MRSAGNYRLSKWDYQPNVDGLAEDSIRNDNYMFKTGNSCENRERDSRQIWAPEYTNLEFIRLSDLVRIPGMKGLGARLYYDAGLDTVEKITYMEPDELRERKLTYGEETGLVGVPTLPVEANYSVEKARE